MKRRRGSLALAAALVAGAAAAAPRVTGRVVIATSGAPAAGAEVLLTESGLLTRTDGEGHFVFEEVDPGGGITIHVHLGFLSGEATYLPDLSPGAEIALTEPIRIAFLGTRHEHVTVTAASGEPSGFGAFGTVISFEGPDLLAGTPSLAELLEGAPGLAIRSLGPGPARPIIRGFDGDRVLVTEDGVRTGDIGSQAAEQGTIADPTQAERIEVVRGPAALLYGTNSVGGVVNLVSIGSQLAHSEISGFQGRASLGAGTADDGRTGGARIQAGGDGWFAWGGGNTRRTGDYRSPLGSVEGSHTALDQGEAGFGLRGDRATLSAGVRLDDSRYGVPLAGMLHGAAEGEQETVDVAMERRQVRTDFGFEGLGDFFEAAAFTVRYSEFVQDEIEMEGNGPPELETHHENRSLVFRGELEGSSGRLQSRIGAWANFREFTSAGPEALAPDTRHTAVAAFALGEIRASDRLSVLLGARLENNTYDADDRPEPGEDGDDDDDDHEEVEGGGSFEPPAVVDRAFPGASASAGLRLDLSAENALVGTATISTRAPALEELYNFGLDAGIQAFEIGNPLLEPERSRGFDLSVRRDTDVFAGSASVFWYGIDNFTYGATTGGRGGVTVISTEQADARHLGFEAGRPPPVRHGRPGRDRLLGGREVSRPRPARAPDTAAERAAQAGRPGPGPADRSAAALGGAHGPPLHRGDADGRLRGPRPDGLVAARERERDPPPFRGRAQPDRRGVPAPHLGDQGRRSPDGAGSAYQLFDPVLLTRVGQARLSRPSGPRCRSEGPHRENWPAFPDVAPQMGRGVRISYSIRFF